MEKVDEMKDWATNVQCKAGFWKDEIPCGGTFTVTESDLVVETIDVMGECEMEVIGIKCPECGSYTELGIDDVPEVIRNRVLGKYYRKQKGHPKQGGGFKGWLARVFG